MWSSIWSVATLDLASELESDLQNTVDWGREWLVNFIAGKTQLVLFDWFNSNGAIHMEMDGSFLEEKYLLRCWGWCSLLNWIEAFTLSLLLKLSPRKLEPWFVRWSFFLLRVLCICINLLQPCMECCRHAGMVLIVSTGNCWISYRNGYAVLLVLHLLPLLNHWLIFEMYPAEVFFICITLVDVHLNWLNWFHFLIL